MAGNQGAYEAVPEGGMPLIPELMKYNESFDLGGPGKRKAKERDKLFEVFHKFRMGKDPMEQSNIKDFFFHQNKDITPEDLEEFRRMRLDRIQEYHLQQQ